MFHACEVCYLLQWVGNYCTVSNLQNSHNYLEFEGRLCWELSSIQLMIKNNRKKVLSEWYWGGKNSIRSIVLFPSNIDILQANKVNLLKKKFKKYHFFFNYSPYLNHFWYNPLFRMLLLLIMIIRPCPFVSKFWIDE